MSIIICTKKNKKDSQEWIIPISSAIRKRVLPKAHIVITEILYSRSHYESGFIENWIAIDFDFQIMPKEISLKKFSSILGLYTETGL